MLHKSIEFMKYILSFRKKDLVLPVKHAEVISELTQNAKLTLRYIFMILIAVTFATIGIMLNDITILVGAMLIAPMLSPIFLLGFAICRVNYAELLISIRNIIISILLAISLSYLIAKISPIHEIAPEIISRTKPNIYHLLVAFFSGAVGTYTIIKRKGGEMVGVAIASALIPPLSLVGFSIALGDYEFAQQAALLFLTNLVSIALSGTLLARLYGFGLRVSKLNFISQVSAYLIAIIMLSVPLILSLKEIAYERLINSIIIDRIHQSFSTNEDMHLIKINFSNSSDKLIKIRAVVFTDKYNQTAQKDILYYLHSKTDRPITLKIEQVLYLRQ